MMHAAADGDFEADESQYLLSDTDTDTRTVTMTGTQRLCCLSFCIRNFFARLVIINIYIYACISQLIVCRYGEKRKKLL